MLCYMNGGFSTGYFDINRGVRQGDPLSSLLFVAALEVLLIQIKSDANIEGIDTNVNTCIELSCYADDLTCFVKNVKSANCILQLLNKFYICSSLKVNVEAMWLGSSRNSNDKPLTVTWSNHTKVLGIVFSYLVQACSVYLAK